MAVGRQLIDREELVGGIAVGVKGVMARYAMKGKVLDGGEALDIVSTTATVA